MFRISASPHSNFYNTVTFEFFPLEWMTSPPVSLLKSLIMTTFIGQVDFFLLFKVGGTMNSLSLLHINLNIMWELRWNGSDLLPALLRQYCSCKFDGKMFSISATCCLNSSQMIVNGMMSSFWLPLALSLISKVIWKALPFIVGTSHIYDNRDLPSSSPDELSTSGSGSTGGIFLGLWEVGAGMDFFLSGAMISNLPVDWRVMLPISILELDLCDWSSLRLLSEFSSSSLLQSSLWSSELSPILNWTCWSKVWAARAVLQVGKVAVDAPVLLPDSEPRATKMLLEWGGLHLAEGWAQGCSGWDRVLLAGVSSRFPVEEDLGSLDVGFDDTVDLFSTRVSWAFSACSFLWAHLEALPMAKDVELQESLTMSLQYICLKHFLYSNWLWWSILHCKLHGFIRTQSFNSPRAWDECTYSYSLVKKNVACFITQLGMKCYETGSSSMMACTHASSIHTISLMITTRKKDMLVRKLNEV